MNFRVKDIILLHKFQKIFVQYMKYIFKCFSKNYNWNWKCKLTKVYKSTIWALKHISNFTQKYRRDLSIQGPQAWNLLCTPVRSWIKRDLPSFAPQVLKLKKYATYPAKINILFFIYLSIYIYISICLSVCLSIYWFYGSFAVCPGTSLVD